MKLLETPYGLFHAWDRDDITRALAKGEFWDKHLNEAINDTRFDGWAVNVGANIGFQALYLSKRFAQVLAIEAHPKTAELLANNLLQNGVSNATVVSGAAYSHHTTVEPATSAVHGWPEAEMSFADGDQIPHIAGMSFVEDPTQQHPMHEWPVKTVLVDELVPPDAEVRLMLIDCQGAALRALIGSQHTITQWRPRIIFEFEGHVSQCRGDDWAAYERFFEQHDYTLTRIPGPWDDFLAVPQ